MNGGLRTQKPSLTLLAGDIGATNSRISLFRTYETESECRLELLRHETFPSQQHPSLLSILQKFASHYPHHQADLGCFGIPGPVKGDTSVTTNLPWQVHADEIAKAMGIRKIWLLNDLEAIAHGLLHLDAPDLKALNPIPVPGEGGNAAVIAPGSGLGEAGIYWDGERYHPFGTEGGHCLFSPASAEHIEIHQYLLKKYSRVSWERLLSGPGIVHLYSYLRDTGKAAEPDWLKEKFREGNPPNVITEEALAGTAEICVRTIWLFFELLAHESANLALKTMATGGLYIGGGIVPRILPLLDENRFQEVFTRQGRLSKVLETIPVRVVLNGETGIIGSAYYALARNPDHAETPVGLQTSQQEGPPHARIPSNA